MTRRDRLVTAAALLVALVAAAPTRAAPPAQGFASPDDAVAALVDAVGKGDTGATARILGPGSEALVRSGDPVKDAEERRRFLDAYAARHALVAEGAEREVLQVGTDDWPLPIPLVRRDGRWSFDSRAGAQEIVDRRIGRNELAAIRVCLTYVDAQAAYFDLFRDATGTGAYAQRLVSTPGNYDGLYWPSADGVPDSPLAPLLASAVEEGYPGEVEAGKRVPYQGYFYRVLTAQGPDAPGGARSYLEGGRMTGGFALVAWPASHGASGLMTFVVARDGTVFQRDLGPDTAARVARMVAYDPGLDWARIAVDPPTP